MLEVYRECKPYLNLTNNQNIATNIKALMVEDHWDTFSSGSQLCGKTHDLATPLSLTCGVVMIHGGGGGEADSFFITGLM